MRPNVGIAWLTAAAVTLPGRAAAAVPAACAKDGLAQPPAAALARKNAALDLRDAGSWADASRSFRAATEELPACPELGDVRLRWSLWAVDAFERGATTADDRRALVEFLARQLAILDGHPTSRELPELPRLRAVHQRLRPQPAGESAANGEPAPDARASRKLPALLLGLGGAVLVPSLALVGVGSARNRRLDAELHDGGLYEEFELAGCGLVPAEDFAWSDAATCASLRSERTRVREAGAVNDRIVIAGAVATALGASLALAGLVTLLRRSPRAERARVRVVPALAGLRVEGRF